jgi:hypothetical protein
VGVEKIACGYIIVNLILSMGSRADLRNSQQTHGIQAGRHSLGAGTYVATTAVSALATFYSFARRAMGRCRF